MLAHGGYKVKTFEKNSYLGGACSSYSKDGYTFDRAVHLFTLGLNGSYGRILKRLGLKKLTFIKELNKRTIMKMYRMEEYYPLI